MPVNRRRFLQDTLAGAAAANFLSRLPAFGQQSAPASAVKPYGSGHFGSWIQDEFNLPAFSYTCDQTKDPKAVTQLNPGILSSTEHVHQIGNDRILAVASNYGHVRVRQDEGAPKFLNDHAPERGIYAGGFGYLTDGRLSLSTFYSESNMQFERVFGIGYFRKRVSSPQYKVDQVIFAPFGDDPVLVSQVTITNVSSAPSNLRWIEYWGCQLYPFSFRSFMESHNGRSVHDLRRELDARVNHNFKVVADGAGLLDQRDFSGRDPAEEKLYKDLIASVDQNPASWLTVPSKEVPKAAVFDDLNPPPVFLVSLDGPPSAVSTGARQFFGQSGPAQPAGLARPLDNSLDDSGTESGLLLEQKFSLPADGSRTLSFLYGYIPSGFDLDGLVTKYRQNARTALRESCSAWKTGGLHFSTEEEPWVEREVSWHNYYLRSGMTYDDFFHQHVLSVGGIHQYVAGFQGPARDSLKNMLPLLFSNPDLAKEVLRCTLKEVRPDGSIPYSVTGHGMIVPTVLDNSSDMPLWLIWAVCEYLLATRDVRFLDSEVVTVYGADPNAIRGQGAGRDTVRNLLARCYHHLDQDVKMGEHGLMRILRDDGNDSLFNGWVPQADIKECVEKGESVLNSAMAAYVFDRYARTLAYAGDEERITAPIRIRSEQHREAVRSQWTGKWYKRAWLGSDLGWLGEKSIWLEPQPWALISRTADEQQTKVLVQSIDEQLRRPSPIGALQLASGPDQQAGQEAKIERGTAANGGVRPSLNQILIWALSGLDAAMAWDEWKKNSLARHAEVYPDIWYGVWSGPDVLNSVDSKQPGQTTSGAPIGRTDFPVFDLQVHASALFSMTKLLGLEFFEAGVSWSPGIPVPSFRFESPLLGLIKTQDGYEGWYNPSSQNTWSVRLKLTGDELKKIPRVEANGEQVHRPRIVDSAIEMRGTGGGGLPMKWKVSRS